MCPTSPRPPRGILSALSSASASARNVVWADGMATLEHPEVIAATRQATWLHQGTEVAFEHDGIVTFVQSEVSVEPSVYRGQATGWVVRRRVTREIVAVIV